MLLEKLADRLKEPSTWAGIASLAQGVSLLLKGAIAGPAWPLVIGGLAAIYLPEKAQKKNVEAERTPKTLI